MPGVTSCDLGASHPNRHYAHVIENGTGARPGAAILHKVAVALGVTLADVLGREVRPQAPTEIPASLLEFALSAVRGR
jgi:hypothetical protein